MLQGLGVAFTLGMSVVILFGPMRFIRLPAAVALRVVDPHTVTDMLDRQPAIPALGHRLILAAKVILPPGVAPMSMRYPKW